MKKPWLYTAVFAGFYIIFLLISLPASVVLGFVTLPQGVILSGVHGTIWQTQINKVITPKVSLSQVTSELSFWSLLAFNPSVDLTFRGTSYLEPDGKLTLSGLTSSIEITDASLFISAELIAPFIPSPIPVQAYGDVAITIDHYVQGEPICQTLQGDIKWLKAKIAALDETVSLGEFAATAKCLDGAAQITISPENELGLVFTALISGNKMSGEGFLLPSENFPEKLKPTLIFLGTPDQEGKYRLFF